MIMNEVRKTMALAQSLCDPCDDKSHSMSCHATYSHFPLEGPPMKGQHSVGLP